MSENNEQVSKTSSNEGENAGAGNKTTKPGSEEQLSFFSTWPWYAQLVLILSVIACIVVLLVGLPVASLMIVDNMSPGSLSPTVSFWGALFAAFISLTTLFVAAAFAFTAFKVETDVGRQVRRATERAQEDAKKLLEGVKSEAQEAIQKEIETKLVGLIGKEAKKYVDDNGQRITRQSADDYIRDKWEKITKQAADGYFVNNGRTLVIEAAGEYLKNHAPGPTKESAETYIEEHGERIATEVMEKYAKKRIGLRGWLRGIVKPKGAIGRAGGYIQAGFYPGHALAQFVDAFAQIGELRVHLTLQVHDG